MDNKELEKKIKEILNEKNFFDMIVKTLEFEKEYKNSDFYKLTKMPIQTVIEKAKLFYFINLDDLGIQIQEKLNELNTDKLMMAIEGLGNVFENENAELMQVAKEFGQNLK